MSWMWIVALCTGLALAQDEEEEPPPEPSIRYKIGTEIHFDAIDVSGELLGATPGGAQDIRFFRDQVADGQVPLPQVFTPEGLFSEHDLPLEAPEPCSRLMCTHARATEARLAAQPDVRWMAQLGFSSGLTEDYVRPPLNLVAVVDKSGSMSNTPIETVKASLRAVVEQLGPEDQLSIVLYGSEVHTHLAPTSGARAAALISAIDAIEIAGSTNLEAGLVHGFELARRTRRAFDGTTRVMLFTDERPNTGRTDAEGFMGLAEAASRDGIGMTTVGVGVQFGAELAQRVSAVRGGNLFFFSDPGEMADKIAADFDLMVTELAYDLEVTVRPAGGLSIAGIYGVPGDLVRWTDDGGLQLQIATVFLSRSRGGIYVALAPDGPLPRRVRRGSTLADVTLGYEARDGIAEPITRPIAWVDPGPGDEGLTRGIALVDEATTLKQATALHHQDNDQEGAYQLVHALLGRLQGIRDGALEPERELVRQLDATLARLAGRAGEAPTQTSRLDPITGLPLH